MPVEALRRHNVKLSRTDIEVDKDDSKAHPEKADAKRKEFAGFGSTSRTARCIRDI
jgi:hypothetical protein